MILAQNEQIRAELIARWVSLGLYSLQGKRQQYAEIAEDAYERAPWMKITPDRLSRWLNNKPAGLTDTQIEWLATRWGIKIEQNLVVEAQQYDELKCVMSVREKFPKPAK